ncbi:heterogeneous nuclear ribonucleoprotein U-like protein 1 [Daphnia pulex]|uniref:heterogeneous nuclear ribonucleoprotein U-like protein 1 n=1 Tax=Daphnia pulex TaxID=6669 RepID=UPI001EDE4E28|nr:heterogeneous nuclear ribonucleoprotein U-like protein 1 [Daphnia pulex]
MVCVLGPVGGGFDLVEGLGCAVYAALDVYDVTDYVYDGCEAEKHRILSRDLKQMIEFLLSAVSPTMDKRKRYAVEKIIGIGKSQFGDTWYLVKWEDYRKTTWVYDGDCDGCPNRIREFLEGFKGKPVPLRLTKPFSVEQRQIVEERRRREMGLGKQGLEEDTPEVADRGDERQRNRSPNPANVNEFTEDEPECDGSLVVLDWYNSDLNLTINKTDFVSGAPLTEAVFAYMYAGARATYGFENGKVCYEVKVTENLAVSYLEESEPNRHIVCVGWSVDSTSYQLGEDPFSYGYGGTAKISQNCEFKDYGVPFKLNDVVGVYLKKKNQGVAFSLPREELNGRALFPHILTKSCRFEVNFGQKEEPWFPPTEGYKWASKIPVEKRIRGAFRPATRADCQIIAMCGLPYAGKTTFANKFSAENPDLKINILGTNALLVKMKVNGLPRRKNYTGKKFYPFFDKCIHCLNILIRIAARRRRNYILDLTNIYLVALKKKMNNFSGFKRKAVVIVPTEEEAKVRENKKIQEEGRDEPDSVVLQMKADFKIPSVDKTFSEVEFPELEKEEALKVIAKYCTEAKATKYGLLLPKVEQQNLETGKNMIDSSSASNSIGQTPPLPRNDPDPPHCPVPRKKKQK